MAQKRQLTDVNGGQEENSVATPPIVSDDDNNQDRGDREEDEYIPPQFAPLASDEYITPVPGQLISYIWTREPEVDYVDYRVGVLVTNTKNGTVRFYQGYNETPTDIKFYLNKGAFKSGDFRVRTDLKIGRWVHSD